jgi:Mn-containing catalase
MILRIDRLAIELPAPEHPSPNSASAVQELLGGKFGEMSTLMNYTFQSFNFRGRSQLKPFYDLIANIAAEEYGHIELVSHTINMLLTGSTTRGTDPSDTPLEAATDWRNHYHFIASGQTALPIDSQGNPWNGTYVFSSGNLKLDLLHNFFLECGARANKIRVYEMVDDPVAREIEPGRLSRDLADLARPASRGRLGAQGRRRSARRGAGPRASGGTAADVAAWSRRRRSGHAARHRRATVREGCTSEVMR